MSNILQSSLSSAFAGLTASLKPGFADLGKLIQDSKRPEAQEIGSESGDSGDEDSEKNESDEPPAKRQKAADCSPAIIEKLTKDLALEDEKGPDINVQLSGFVHKLVREAKPNETKQNELKKQYIKKQSSLLSEAIMTQTDVDCLLNDESLNTSEAPLTQSRSMTMAALPLR